VDLSGGHDTGLAIANLADTSATITVAAYLSEGAFLPIGTSRGPLQLAGYGHAAKFATELISVCRLVYRRARHHSRRHLSAALTLRSLNNERNDFLMTTFPVADVNHTAPSPVVFPQIADGGGYVTEFVLARCRRASKTTLTFFDTEGRPARVGK